MRRKHGGRESGVGMLNQRGRRDAAISTAERKWACQDRDKLRQREREIRGQPDISESNAGGKGRANRMVENKSDGQRERQTRKKKRDQGSVFRVPARRKCQWSLWEPARPRKKWLVNKSKLTQGRATLTIFNLGSLTRSAMWGFFFSLPESHFLERLAVMENIACRMYNLQHIGT